MSFSDNELPMIPSMLLQTFPLEAYLQTLSSKLTERLNALKSAVDTVRTDVKSNTVSVGNICQFLREQSLKAMQDMTHEGSTELPDGTSLELLLPEFLREDAVTCTSEGRSSSTASFVRFEKESKKTSVNELSSLIEKINKDNTQRVSLENERARQRSEEADRRFEKVCAEMEMLQKRYMKSLERLEEWFRPAGNVGGESNSNGDNTETSSMFSVETGLHDVLQGAPLFVEFRKFLLRDMMDRLEEAKDQQSMVLGNTVVALKEEMRQEMLQEKANNRVGGLTIDRSLGDVDVAEMGRRLKGLDRNYMQRNETMALLQEKAGVAAVAKKADDVYVREMERRLLDRLDAVEERMSLYEAERSEFRRILRAVVDAGQRGRNCVISDTTKERDNGVTQSMAGAPVNFFVAEDAADPRRVLVNKQSLAHDEQQATRRTKTSNQKQWPGSGDVPSAMTRQQQDDGPQQQRSCGVEGAPEVSRRREAVGLTVNQEAYANYVTHKLNRRDVEMLPPLPYERMRFQ